jgi:hypothetical protein
MNIIVFTIMLPFGLVEGMHFVSKTNGSSHEVATICRYADIAE